MNGRMQPATCSNVRDHRIGEGFQILNLRHVSKYIYIHTYIHTNTERGREREREELDFLLQQNHILFTRLGLLPAG